jgi:DNA-binding NtrC family response regulator
MKNRAEVLVLDDEAIVCERLKAHLETNGFQVETFTESRQAMQRLTEKTFDVVVTDLKMEARAASMSSLRPGPDEERR